MHVMQLLFGLFHLPWWGYVIVTLILTHITVACVTLFLHRSQAHRAMDFHPAVSQFMRFWLWLTTGIVTREWVAIHRKHHAKCETSEDPHSPQMLGIKKVFFEGAELYVAAKTPETLERYGFGTPNDWMERHIYRHNGAGIFLMFLIDVLCFGVVGLTVWAVQMMWQPLFAAGVINGIGHYWGYRNFECADASRNICPISIVTCGEELHNNHHAFGSSAKLSVKPWEFDLGWAYVRILQCFKLVKVHKTVPQYLLNTDKTQIDVDTLKAFVTNRLHILAKFSQQVMMPVWQDERAQAASKPLRKALTKARTWLIRDASQVTPEGKNRLLEALKQTKQLAQVYQAREKLLAIWMRTTASQRELIDALQEWCKQAEATHIEVLTQFAKQLRGFVPVSMNTKSA